MFGIPDAEADESFLQESLVASTLSLDMDDQGSTLHAKRELTSCGQNGNELSGGQQARVALARCIYASLAGSEAVILDDPIKALDPATAALCWQQAIKGTMAGKTRVLVVNSQMLQRFASDKAVDRLIIVEKGGDDQPGRVTFNGKPSEMPASIPERLGDGYRIPDEPVEEPDEPTDDAMMVGYYVGNGEEPSVAACYSGAGKGDPKEEPEAAGKKKDKKKKRQKFQVKGDKGTVFAAVTNYCRRMGPWIVISGVLMGANQAANIVTYRWNSVLAANPQRFRVNYAIAIVLMVAAQAVRALSDFSRDGMGGETASKSMASTAAQTMVDPCAVCCRHSPSPHDTCLVCRRPSSPMPGGRSSVGSGLASLAVASSSRLPVPSAGSEKLQQQSEEQKQLHKSIERRNCVNALDHQLKLQIEIV